jgi:hypothetical protein
MMRAGLSGIGGIVLLLCSHHSVFAQASVPFVGCRSEGQADPINAPTGTSILVSMSPEAAQRLAFYEAKVIEGVLAPRGWYCLGTYGSGGASLLVSPEPIDRAKLLSRGLADSVVLIAYSSGGSSGRFAVAEMIARVFPAWRWFADQVYKGYDQTAPAGPYPKDRLNYKGKTIVEYETPAKTDGLGTGPLIEKNGSPINGVAILVGQTPDLVLLSVRLPVGLSKLTSEIVSQVERANAK